ncbi:hypothetical protein DFH06DRAFT_1147761 [Mycena polygramma]|nr:hypothetical protein DFH06DRAFT_1147761 [Mycena polygramma]
MSVYAPDNNEIHGQEEHKSTDVECATGEDARGLAKSDRRTSKTGSRELHSAQRQRGTIPPAASTRRNPRTIRLSMPLKGCEPAGLDPGDGRLLEAGRAWKQMEAGLGDGRKAGHRRLWAARGIPSSKGLAAGHALRLDESHLLAEGAVQSGVLLRAPAVPYALSGSGAHALPLSVSHRVLCVGAVGIWEGSSIPPRARRPRGGSGVRSRVLRDRQWPRRPAGADSGDARRRESDTATLFQRRGRHNEGLAAEQAVRLDEELTRSSTPEKRGLRCIPARVAAVHIPPRTLYFSWRYRTRGVWKEAATRKPELDARAVVAVHAAEGFFPGATAGRFQVLAANIRVKPRCRESFRQPSSCPQVLPGMPQPCGEYGKEAPSPTLARWLCSRGLPRSRNDPRVHSRFQVLDKPKRRTSGVELENAARRPTCATRARRVPGAPKPPQTTASPSDARAPARMQITVGSGG